MYRDNYITALRTELLEMVSQFRTDDRRFDADPIKAALGRWTLYLSQVITGQREASTDDVLDSAKCRFGRWITGEAPELFGSFSGFENLQAEYRRIHATASEALRSHQAGNRDGGTEIVTEIRSAAKRMYAHLDELEQQANDLQPIQA